MRFTLLVLPVILVSTPVFSCTCLDPPRPQTALTYAAAVFSGKVISEQTNTLTMVKYKDKEIPWLYMVFTFQVERLWKGDISKTVSVSTGMGGGDCGYSFHVGEQYLVYAGQERKDKLGTSICSRTCPLDSSAAEDLRELGKGREPAEEKVPNHTVEPTRAPEGASGSP